MLWGKGSLWLGVVWDNGMGRSGWRVAMAFSQPNVPNRRKKKSDFFILLFFNRKVFSESPPWEKLKLSCLSSWLPSWDSCANFTSCPQHSFPTSPASKRRDVEVGIGAAPLSSPASLPKSQTSTPVSLKPGFTERSVLWWRQRQVQNFSRTFSRTWLQILPFSGKLLAIHLPSPWRKTLNLP